MGLIVFLAIVGVVVWFVYSGMKRQNARFGAFSPVTRVPDASLSPRQAQMVYSEPVESVPLYVNLQQSFRGEHDKIVRTLNDVADMLQKEVDVRTFSAAQAPSAARVDHETYRNLVSQQSNRLMVMFQDAEIGFERASSPTGGTPEMLRQAYAAFLDQLIAAARTFSSTQAPLTYDRTQTMYREFLKEFYEQIADWPNTLRAASKSINGDSCDVVLSANYDIGPMEQAIKRYGRRPMGTVFGYRLSRKEHHGWRPARASRSAACLIFRDARKSCVNLERRGESGSIVINLARVDHVDSRVLGLFVSFRRRFIEAGGNPNATQPAPQNELPLPNRIRFRGDRARVGAKGTPA